jgi:excisionase family DNA binding protein
MMASIFKDEAASGTLQSVSGVASDTLLTPREVAEMLRVPISWVYERTRRHGTARLPHIKIGKYLRFRKEDVLGWLDEYRI